MIDNIIVYVFTSLLGFVSVSIFKISSNIAVIKKTLDDFKEEKKSLEEKYDEMEKKINHHEISIELIKQNCLYNEKNK